MSPFLSSYPAIGTNFPFPAQFTLAFTASSTPHLTGKFQLHVFNLPELLTVSLSSHICVLKFALRVVTFAKKDYPQILQASLASRGTITPTDDNQFY
jgi:hypothetical protein